MHHEHNNRKVHNFECHSRCGIILEVKDGKLLGGRAGTRSEEASWYRAHLNAFLPVHPRISR